MSLTKYCLYIILIGFRSNCFKILLLGIQYNFIIIIAKILEIPFEINNFAVWYNLGELYIKTFIVKYKYHSWKKLGIFVS